VQSKLSIFIIFKQTNLNDVFKQLSSSVCFRLKSNKIIDKTIFIA